MRGNPRTSGIKSKYDCITTNGHFTTPLRLKSDALNCRHSTQLLTLHSYFHFPLKFKHYKHNFLPRKLKADCFEPTTSAGELPQTYALDRAATGTGM